MVLYIEILVPRTTTPLSRIHSPLDPSGLSMPALCVTIVTLLEPESAPVAARAVGGEGKDRA